MSHGTNSVNNLFLGNNEASSIYFLAPILTFEVSCHFVLSLQTIHAQAKTKVPTSLLTSCKNFSKQIGMKMRSYGLRQLVDDKSVASCQQTCCKSIVKIFYPQACSKLVRQVVTRLQMTSCNKADFNRPVVT